GRMTRGSIPFAQSNAFIYTQIGGSWLYFAFIEGVVMRMFDDLALWRVLCTGMLLSDIWYCAGTVQGVGGLANWTNLAAWTDDDWITMVSTLPMVIVRVLIVLGIGVSVSSRLDRHHDGAGGSEEGLDAKEDEPVYEWRGLGCGYNSTGGRHFEAGGREQC
ncbi:hypothetical protein CEP53_006660, partial [Fusarium sp. AF-6]